jgi:hypothetical protein
MKGVVFRKFHEGSMVLKNVFAVILCTTLLAWSGSSSEFAPVAIEARTDSTGAVEQARVEPEAQAKPLAKPRAKTASVRPSVRNADVAQARVEKPRGVARTRVAHRRGNPLDAQAQDTRIQAWPCKSGGICNWK